MKTFLVFDKKAQASDASSKHYPLFLLQQEDGGTETSLAAASYRLQAKKDLNTLLLLRGLEKYRIFDYTIREEMNGPFRNIKRAISEVLVTRTDLLEKWEIIEEQRNNLILTLDCVIQNPPVKEGKEEEINAVHAFSINLKVLHLVEASRFLNEAKEESLPFPKMFKTWRKVFKRAELNKWANLALETAEKVKTSFEKWHKRAVELWEESRDLLLASKTLLLDLLPPSETEISFALKFSPPIYSFLELNAPFGNLETFEVVLTEAEQAAILRAEA